MSDETNESSSGSSPPKASPEVPESQASTAAKPAGAGATPATPATPAAKPEPPPPEPGEFGKRLECAGYAVEHLGLDAWGKEGIRLQAGDLLKACEVLRDEAQFDLALSCAGVDWKTHRESVYHLYSLTNHNYLTVKVNADASDHSPSLFPVWPAVDWHERESYDLMGITYDGHPDLKRILMPIDWLGHPLRKDYKVDDPRLVWNER